MFEPTVGGFGLSLHQLAAQQIQIRQARQPIDLCGVFLQAPVTVLAETELAFDDLENMLDGGADRRVFAVALTLATRQVFAGLAFVVD